MFCCRSWSHQRRKPSTSMEESVQGDPSHHRKMPQTRKSRDRVWWHGGRYQTKPFCLLLELNKMNRGCQKKIQFRLLCIYRTHHSCFTASGIRLQYKTHSRSTPSKFTAVNVSITPRLMVINVLYGLNIILQ